MEIKVKSKSFVTMTKRGEIVITIDQDWMLFKIPCIDSDPRDPEFYSTSIPTEAVQMMKVLISKDLI